MPRVHVRSQTIDEIESDWDAQFTHNLVPRAESRDVAERREHGVRRPGGAEALDRKRAERRKHSRRNH